MKVRILFACLAIVGIGGLTGVLAQEAAKKPAAAAQKPATQPAAPKHTTMGGSDADIIKSAMTAAPAAIAKGATIINVGEDHQIRTVRKGTNNFTCMADNPETPGPDPMCADANAMEWVQAWLGKKQPPASKVGVMYMLEGGTDASNTDPYATKPDATNNWVKTGPHIMIVGAKGMLDAYPRQPKPNTSQPYVMWPGTPYEHLMMPVK
jgi:pectate lyase